MIGKVGIISVKNGVEWQDEEFQGAWVLSRTERLRAGWQRKNEFNCLVVRNDGGLICVIWSKLPAF